jgi:hypothetical protein
MEIGFAPSHVRHGVDAVPEMEPTATGEGAQAIDDRVHELVLVKFGEDAVDDL